MGVQQGKKGQVGGVGGAAAGALIGQAIGHDYESTLIGTALGGFLGYILGNEMDKYDQSQISRVAEREVSGQANTWSNPDNGRRMTAVPGPAYTAGNGQLCRPMIIQGTVPGRSPETVRVTVCRQIDPSTLNAVWVAR